MTRSQRFSLLAVLTGAVALIATAQGVFDPRRNVTLDGAQWTWTNQLSPILVTATDGTGFTTTLAFAAPTANRTLTIPTNTGTLLTSTGAVTSSSATSGVGYSTGAGCAITQITGRTTGVTCTGLSGAITLVSAAGSATPASFTVTDTSIAVGDTVIINERSGTDLYEIFITTVAAGSFKVTFFTTGGTTTEQPVFNFAVIKAVSS